MKPGSLSYFTIFMTSFISSFEIISIIVSDLNIFRLIAASVAELLLLILMVLKHV